MRRWMAGVLICALSLVGVAVPAMAVNVNEILSGDKSICDDPTISDDLKETAGCTIDKNKTVVPVAIGLIQAALGVIGIVAVGIVIYGGVTYSLSLGDAAKVYRAKNIILYGMVGLGISLLSFLVVTFISQSIWG